MNLSSDPETPEDLPPFSPLRAFLSKIPTGELYSFGIFLFAQGIQWSALIQMCRTEGEYGTMNFITTMTLSASAGFSLNRLSEAFKVTLFLSFLAMSFYFLSFGW